MKVAIVGAAGRMGQHLIEASLSHTKVKLTVAVEHAGHQAVGRDVGQLLGGSELSVCIGDNLAEQVAHFDVAIDFTRPEGTLKTLDICLAHSKGLVIGTTGFDAQGKQRIEHAAQKNPCGFLRLI